MRKVVLSISALCLVSCSKEWKCTITTDQTYLGYTSHSVNTVTFTGTKDEMEAYEAKGTKNTPTLTQSTVCK